MSTSSTFSPLRYRAFLLIWLASLISHLGNQIQATGAAWHLTEQGQPADIVALVQTATNLPFMILAVAAGAWADMYDRRKVMLLAQSSMFIIALVLALLAGLGMAGPFLLIGLTALLACGVTIFIPALASSIGNFVPRHELAAAVALNILGFNVARSVGPALGGAIIATGGVQAAFIVNAISYLTVIVVVLRMAPMQSFVTERRALLELVSDGIRFSASSRPIRNTLLRALTFTFAGGGIWALAPLFADRVLHGNSVTFGLLIGALGVGAVIGGLLSTYARSRLSAEALIRLAGIVFGSACVCVALLDTLPIILFLLAIGGAAWVQAGSTFVILGQLWSPRELVGRVSALSGSCTFGGLALGAWTWGHVAQFTGVSEAILLSGATALFLPVLGLILPVPSHRGPEPEPSQPTA